MTEIAVASARMVLSADTRADRLLSFEVPPQGLHPVFRQSKVCQSLLVSPSDLHHAVGDISASSVWKKFCFSGNAI
jgi:hypothetical protein